MIEKGCLLIAFYFYFFQEQSWPGCFIVFGLQVKLKPLFQLFIFNPCFQPLILVTDKINNKKASDSHIDFYIFAQ